MVTQSIDYGKDSKLMQKVRGELEEIREEFDVQRMLDISDDLVELANLNVKNRQTENIIPIYEEVTSLVQENIDTV